MEPAIDSIEGAFSTKRAILETRQPASPDNTRPVLESISGHLSRRMMEHYSHIRIDAKRQALDALDAARRSTAHNGEGNGNVANGRRFRRSSRSATTLRHSHVTVWFCADRRLPVNC
jgi:hypothetical protein